ncbi:MAG TPA: cupredoxin domain-containing protein [Acidimicrobiales bacterium]|nr:cupredoxin domain-containing protein [Acidimicrobiales bacterium]
MLTLPSKLLFALVGLAAVAAVGYGVVVGERSGIVLLAGVAVAAAVLGSAFLAVRDSAPFVPPDAPPPDPRATTPGSPARPSAWPLLAALDVGLVAVGAAVDDSLVYAGVALGIAAALGWFGRAWSEHPSWTPRVRERVDYRFLVPLGLPVGMIALTVVIAISFSRVLLAVSKDASVLIALVVAVAILAGMWFIAVRPGVGSSSLVVLAGLAGISTIGAGIAGAAQGERKFEHHGHERPEVEIVAEDVAFEQDEVVVPARTDVDIVFTNHDAVFHNVAVYEGDGPEAVPIFNGEGFEGEATRTYEVKTPESGTYTFVCDFHPNMKGQFVVE